MHEKKLIYMNLPHHKKNLLKNYDLYQLHFILINIT